MLRNQGHEVSGISLDPQSKSLFSMARLHEIYNFDLRVDLRDLVKLKSALKIIEPDVVIHLAAQPLVGKSYLEPLDTFESNVMGTINILEAAKLLPEIKCMLVITSDKVYKNFGKKEGYDESDMLGGHDAYSASKSAADIAAQCWSSNFVNFPLAIARAGNVIGGGDWAEKRIVTDLVNALEKKVNLELRYPHAVRPWQHVLDCLSGYICLIEFMLKNKQGGIWNFGPKSSNSKTVTEFANLFISFWSKEKDFINIESSKNNSLKETEVLILNSSKSREILGWDEKLDFQTSIAWTVDWYKKLNVETARELCINQIIEYNKINI